MTDAEILEKVKTGLGIATDYQDALLTLYVDEVIEFMVAAGVKKEIARDAASVGCILQGVNDLWNYQNGGTKFSPYFCQRVIQLAAKDGVSNVQTD